jgi:hypothetical protein
MVCLGTRFTVLSALLRRYGLAVYVTRHSLASEGEEIGVVVISGTGLSYIF